MLWTNAALPGGLGDSASLTMIFVSFRIIRNAVKSRIEFARLTISDILGEHAFENFDLRRSIGKTKDLHGCTVLNRDDSIQRIGDKGQLFPFALLIDGLDPFEKKCFGTHQSDMPFASD